MTDEALAAAAVRLATGRARLQPADRDDALQDARLAIWQAHDLFDGRGSFEPFALTRARWAVIDGLRRRHGSNRRPNGKGAGRRMTSSLNVVTDEGSELAELIESPAPGPDRVAEARDMARRVASGIESLTPIEAASLGACSEGRTQRAVASEFGVTPGAITFARRRAIRKIEAA